MPTDEAKELTTVVTPRLLRRVAGERFFGRGEAYFAEGTVRSLRRDGGGVRAVVHHRVLSGPTRLAACRYQSVR